MTVTSLETAEPGYEPPRDTHFMLRPTSGTTLSALRDHYDRHTETVMVDTRTVEVAGAMLRWRTVDAGEGTAYEAPLTDVTIDHLCNWLDLPAPFVRKADHDVQDWLFDRFIRDNPGEMLFEFNDDTGIHDIREMTDLKVDPRRVVDVAAHVVGSDAPVIEGWRSPQEYRFDVVVADGASYGIGGDRAVGDLTKGGLRFSQSMKKPLQPTVAPFLYRLVCTNGMETPDVALPLSLRQASTIDQVMDALEEAAQAAFSEVELHIESFYELRNERVRDPEQLVIRIGNEVSVPEGVNMDLIRRLPALLPEVDPTLFDVVNAVTNQANHPELLAKPSIRRKLERAGGNTIVDHSERCPRCESRII